MSTNNKVLQDLSEIQKEYDIIRKFVQSRVDLRFPPATYNSRPRSYCAASYFPSRASTEDLERWRQLQPELTEFSNTACSFYAVVDISLKHTTKYENVDELTAINEHVLKLCIIAKDILNLKQHKILNVCYKKVDQDLTTEVERATEKLKSQYDCTMKQIAESVKNLKVNKIGCAERALSLLKGLGSLCVSICLFCLLPFAFGLSVSEAHPGALFECWQSMKNHLLNSFTRFAECFLGEPRSMILELDMFQNKIIEKMSQAIKATNIISYPPST